MHGAIWTIIELEEDIMVLNNVTKFHKILIKRIRVRERTSLGQTYVIMYVKYVCTYGHLMPRPISWRGHKNLKTPILTYPAGLEVNILLCHLCICGKALVRLRMCTGLSEPSLLSDAITIQGLYIMCWPND